eukprot:g961.t1
MPQQHQRVVQPRQQKTTSTAGTTAQVAVEKVVEHVANKLDTAEPDGGVLGSYGPSATSATAPPAASSQKGTPFIPSFIEDVKSGAIFGPDRLLDLFIVLVFFVLLVHTWFQYTATQQVKNRRKKIAETADAAFPFWKVVGLVATSAVLYEYHGCFSCFVRAHFDTAYVLAKPAFEIATTQIEGWLAAAGIV